MAAKYFDSSRLPSPHKFRFASFESYRPRFISDFGLSVIVPVFSVSVSLRIIVPDLISGYRPHPHLFPTFKDVDNFRW
jgi:hypothetical protein